MGLDYKVSVETSFLHEESKLKFADLGRFKYYSPKNGNRVDRNLRRKTVVSEVQERTRIFKLRYVGTLREGKFLSWNSQDHEWQ